MDILGPFESPDGGLEVLASREPHAASTKFGRVTGAFIARVAGNKFAAVSWVLPKHLHYRTKVPECVTEELVGSNWNPRRSLVLVSSDGFVDWSHEAAAGRNANASMSHTALQLFQILERHSLAARCLFEVVGEAFGLPFR